LFRFSSETVGCPIAHILIDGIAVIQVIENCGLNLLLTQCWINCCYFLRALAAINILIQDRLNPNPCPFDADITVYLYVKVGFQVHSYAWNWSDCTPRLAKVTRSPIIYLIILLTNIQYLESNRIITKLQIGGNNAYVKT
jgi:hypothetical protein